MRGFNQAAYLAERLSVLTGIPWNEHLVKKIRSTRSQKKLNAIQRRQNLKNAYQVTEKIPGFSVLVVDDVYTTGSTADAMAMCLLEAGAEKKKAFQMKAEKVMRRKGMKQPKKHFS